MNISKSDQSKEREISYLGESVRLGNEFRNHPDIFPNADEPTMKQIKIPAKTDGFDFETCMESDLKKWLASNKKSQRVLFPFSIEFMLGVLMTNITNNH